jgi:integrase
MDTSDKKILRPRLHRGKKRDGSAGRWFVYYYETDLLTGKNKRKKIYGRLNRIEAVEDRILEAERIIKQLAGKGVKNASTSILHRVIDQNKYLWRGKTYKGYKSIVDLFHEWLKHENDAEITPTVARAFLQWLKQSGKSNTTVRNYKIRLCALYNLAYRDSDKKNPFTGITTIKPTPTSLMFFNRRQIEAIKQYCVENNPQLWLAIQLLYYCFIRPGEMRFLKVSDVNIENQFIELRAAISKNKKTQKVAIPQQLLGALGEIVKSPGSCYIFTKAGCPGVMPVTHNYFNTAHRKVLKAVGITGRYAFYSWKHTGAVACVKSGMHIKDLQLQLRHHSLDMVNEYLKGLGVMDSTDLKMNFPGI